MANSIYWHDYETFGSDPRRDRPCQFAGIRTDEELNIIGDPLVLYCRPAPDYLPDPQACLVTGIGPAEAAEKGVPEAEFCARILAELAAPGTCVAGYNSIRFDDEVTRHLLYRCFFDPYEREWKNGNSRWDILDMLRLAHALRPEGIHWPKREDGHTSFRLEHLTRANGIGHDSAHDALSDVLATIEVARLLKRRQPKLYDWCWRHRRKQALKSLLDPARPLPLLHVSGMYPAERGCLAVIVPLARHPHNANGIVVADLGQDPRSWLGLDSEALRERLFTPAAELPEGVERPALKTVHLNKCPALAPLSVLDEQARERWGLDLEACQRHLEVLRQQAELPRRLQALYEGGEGGEGEQDPELMLYSGGFFSDADRAAIARVPACAPEALAALADGFQDARLPELLFRYRARNHPDCLSAEERARWRRWCRDCLSREGPGGWRAYRERLEALRAEQPQRAALLDELWRYAEQLGRDLGLADSPDTVLQDKTH